MKKMMGIGPIKRKVVGAIANKLGKHPMTVKNKLTSTPGLLAKATARVQRVKKGRV